VLDRQHDAFIGGDTLKKGPVALVPLATKLAWQMRARDIPLHVLQAVLFENNADDFRDGLLLENAAIAA